MLIKTGAYVRVGGVPMGVVPHEMLNDPQADKFGSVIREILLSNVFEVIGNAADQENDHA